MRSSAKSPRRAVLAGLLMLVLIGPGSAVAAPVMLAPPATLHHEVVRVLPHDRESFTQGLIIQDDSFVETSGLYGRSFIYRYDKNTGLRLQLKRLPESMFAEGVTALADRLYVLTWKSGVLLVFDGNTLEPVDRRKYTGEGWGITHNSTHFIVSDGSDRLQFRDLETFRRVRELQVRDPGRSWRNLNELEFAEGRVWANVWQTPHVIAINPQSGRVEGVLDLTPLAEANNSHPGESVLNGIAYDGAAGTFWVTGKLWPRRYEIRVSWPEVASGVKEQKPAQSGSVLPANIQSTHQIQNQTHVQ